MYHLSATDPTKFSCVSCFHLLFVGAYGGLSIVLLLDTMSLKVNRAQIEAFKRQLRDEPTDNEHSDDNQTQLSGSMEGYDSQPEPVVTRPQMRGLARAGQTRVQTASPS